MHTTHFGKPRPALRLGSLFAAAAACTVLVGSQFGIADRYVVQADAVLAHDRAQTVAQQTATPAPEQPRS